MALTQIDANAIQPGVITQDLFSETVSFGPTIPLITTIDYPGDDTAADPAGGQTIIIRGSNFTAQSSVYLAGNPVSPLAFVNSSALSFTAPAQTTGVYSLYVVNDNGATAIAVPGLLYSGTPSWNTGAGTLGSIYETGSVSVSLEATGDGTVTYSVSNGNTIPTGLTLNSNGLLTGTVPATDPTTTYTFSVDAIDEQNQETARSFSITFLKDEVTWTSPANGAAYTLGVNTSNTISLSATSAASKPITYTVQSGNLPSNMTIVGSDITGTPNTAQSNTEVVIRATASDTARVSDRTLWFTTAAAGWNLSGATLSQSIDVSGISTGMFGLRFSDSGHRLFLLGSSSTNRYMYQINLDTPWVLPAGSISSSTKRLTLHTYMSNPSGIAFSSDGTKMIVSSYGTTNPGINWFTLNTAWDIGSVSYQGNFNTSAYVSAPVDVFFGNNGAIMYVADDDQGVFQYNLGTSWTPSSASYVAATNIKGISNNSGWSIFIKPDGTKLYFLSYGSGDAWSGTMSTPFDLSTITNNNDGIYVANPGNPRGIQLNEDGTKLWTVSTTTPDSILEFNL